MHGSLVMIDFETESLWSILTGDAVGGELKGTKLKEMPVSQKMQWKDWVKKHPNTLVLSVNGKEDASPHYQSYFRSERGFRGESADDTRLKDKDPVFTLELNHHKYAVPFNVIEGGKAYNVDGVEIFIFRPVGADIFYSSFAFKSTGNGFEKRGNQWIDVKSGCYFDLEKNAFVGGEKLLRGRGACPQRMEGFDTFWYTWSLVNPETTLLQ